MIVIDSGLGGISVVRALRAAQPRLALAYVADTAGFPYGARTAADLAARAAVTLTQATRHHSPSAIVVACNTLSTLCLTQLRAAFAFPVIGTVPAIKVASALSRRFTLLATPNTAHSVYSRDLIDRFANGATVDRHGAPGLAIIAERMLLGWPIPTADLAAQLAPAFHDDHDGVTDTIVLGCTHYPLIVEALREAAPWPVRWIDSSGAIARRALDLAEPADGPSVAYVTSQADVARYRPVFQREGFDRVEAL